MAPIWLTNAISPELTLSVNGYLSHWEGGKCPLLKNSFWDELTPWFSIRWELIIKYFVMNFKCHRSHVKARILYPSNDCHSLNSWCPSMQTGDLCTTKNRGGKNPVTEQITEEQYHWKPAIIKLGQRRKRLKWKGRQKLESVLKQIGEQHLQSKSSNSAVIIFFQKSVHMGSENSSQ